ncbi:MAG TPA: urease accessory UreF family protein [Pseudoxanthomonas sp.]|nr:urease accessory UreF family protein [Pseudoxanthomonas sp.]
MNGLLMARLLQLASPALPVGAYTYSQGLEWAIEAGQVHDEASAARWIGDVLEHNLGAYELPLLFALAVAWEQHDALAVSSLNADYLATREGAELLAETSQMGHSLHRLLSEFPEIDEVCRTTLTTAAHDAGAPAFPTVWSALAGAWGLSAQDSAAAYAWSWAENQVMAALKAVPLGQSAGQRLLHALGARLPAVVGRAAVLKPDDWSNFLPGLALATARHETQYSRLFRS